MLMLSTDNAFNRVRALLTSYEEDRHAPRLHRMSQVDFIRRGFQLEAQM
jgi:hypothetical protein